MSKKLLVFPFVILITGCQPTYTETSGGYSLPSELSDCKIYKLDGGLSETTLHVVRCPDSNTTTSNLRTNGKVTEKIETTIN